MPEVTSIVSDMADQTLAREIAQVLRAEYVPAEVRVFSDGETKIRIPTKIKGSCIIVQSTNPPPDTNLMKLLMMATKCLQDGCARIYAIVPYLAYTRQDRAFLDGEIATIAMISRLFEVAGIQSVITVDIHSEKAISCFNIGVTNISAVPLLATYASTMQLHQPVIISPDAGGQSRAKQFADILKTEWFSLKKNRNRETGEVTVSDDLELNIESRDCILLDDMISTGGSIIKAAVLLQKNGAKNVFAFCTHALLVGDAGDRIKAAGVREIVATNSIPSIHSRVDLSSILAKAAKSQLV